MFKTIRNRLFKGRKEIVGQMNQEVKVNCFLSTDDDGQTVTCEKSQGRTVAKYCLVEEFRLIFILFQIFGFEVNDLNNNQNNSSDTVKKHNLIHSITRLIRGLVFVILFVKVILQTYRLVLLPEEKDKHTQLLLELLFSLIYVLMGRKSQAMLLVIKDLNDSFIMLPAESLKKIKNPYMTYFFVIQILLISIYIASCFFRMEDNSMMKIEFYEVSPLLKFCMVQPRHFFVVLTVFQILFILIALTVIVLFVVYYSLTCRFIQTIYENLLDQTDDDQSIDEVKHLFSVYGKVENTKRVFEENVSFPVFVVVLACMMSLFSATYKTVFQANVTSVYYLALITSGCISMSFQLLIMLSSSVINEISEKTRDAFHSLVYCKAEHKEELKMIFKRDMKGKVNLTLWNIYVVDRSLTVTSLGTLLTYGILIGSLGNNTIG